jgi:hypothetical protein
MLWDRKQEDKNQTEQKFDSSFATDELTDTSGNNKNNFMKCTASLLPGIFSWGATRFIHCISEAL